MASINYFRDHNGNEHPHGTLRAYCVEAGLEEYGENREKVKLVLSLRVDDPDHPDLDGNMYPYYGYFTPGAMPFTVKALRACGWKGMDLEDLSTCVAGSGGLCVHIDVAPNEYDGKIYPRVDWVKVPRDGFVRYEMKKDKKKEFAKKMMGSIMALTKENSSYAEVIGQTAKVHESQASDPEVPVAADPTAIIPF